MDATKKVNSAARSEWIAGWHEWVALGAVEWSDPAEMVEGFLAAAARNERDGARLGHPRFDDAEGACPYIDSPIPDTCTGWFDERAGAISHDGETCPIHESSPLPPSPAAGGCSSCGHDNHDGLVCHHVSGEDEPVYCDCDRTGSDD